MHYWEQTDLKLYFNKKGDCSLDDNAAKKYKVKATAPEQMVTELQTDLAALGYLENIPANLDGYFGGGTRRAVIRFQRHANRSFRMLSTDKSKIDLDSSDSYSGLEDGIVTPSVATEIRKWISKKWVLPFGIYQIVPLAVTYGNNEKLREDAKKAWDAIVIAVTDAGGTLEGPYYDSIRPLRKSSKVGTSKYSVHYSGRAVDINQTIANRYYAQKEEISGRIYWKIYCRTEKQDETQGTKIKKGEFKYTAFFNQSQVDIPAGYYINLTEMIHAGGFSRIPAQKGWDNIALSKNDRWNKLEWWHFQFNNELQKTFLDELELIGISEKDAKANNWNDAELDHAPG